MRRALVALVVLTAFAGGPSALAGGSLTATPSSVDFGTVAAGDSPTKTVTLTNNTGGALTVSSVGISGAGGDLSVSGDTCTSNLLNPNDSCAVDLTYSPTSSGSLPNTASLDVTDDTGTNNVSVAGGAVTNRFTFTNLPGSTAFGQWAVGDTSPPKQVTVHNQTSYTANPNVGLGGSNPGDFDESDNCGSQTGGSDCTANVAFNPQSTGAKSTSLHADGDSLGFTGTGAQATVVSPSSLAFNPQRVGTNSSALPVGVTNNQSSSIALNIGKSGANTADFVIQGSSTCGANLAANSSCTINVVFSPGAAGNRSATLNVAGTGVSMSGTGIQPGASVSPGSVGFGNQPIFTASTSHTVTVTNTGTDNLTVSSVTLGGTSPLQFGLSDTCVATSPVPPNGTCTFQVQFIPTVQGALSARVTVTSDAANSPQTVNLTGTGTPSAVTFSPAGGGTFPTRRRVGTLSTPHVVTLTNRTNSPLVISSVKIAGLNPKSFRITGGTCNGATIQPDHSCTEAVAFGPSVAGTRSATLQVTDNGPNSPHSLSLAGIAIPPKNDRLVRAAVGCQSTHITWVRPSGSRYVGTAIYRNRVRVPRYAGDGLLVKHGTGGLIDRHLLHFTTYNYRIFAKYRSQVTPGTYNYSKGVILKLRTGEVCSPLNNARTTDTTPLVTWLPSPTLHGYALLVYHAGKRVFKPLRSSTTHYQLTSARHLRRGSIYTIFLYAYPPSAPRGKFIGKTTFVVV